MQPDIFTTHLLTQQRNAQFAALLAPPQRALTWGSYCLTVVSEPPLMVIGRIPTRDALMRVEDPMTYGQIDTNMRTMGRLYGRWHSKPYPRGEWGTNHAICCWPIDEATFEWCQELNFDDALYPPDLAHHLSLRVTMLQDHLELTHEQLGG